jgi:hypothetical protein
LIKVGDNGPLSATAKVLSDGLGNDSPIAMSTTQVGIGTTTPNRTLSVNGILGIASAGANAQQLLLSADGVGSYITSSYFGSSSYVPMFLEVGGSVRATITTAGNVGIGTTTPSYLLDIASTSPTLRIRNITPPVTGGTSSLLFEGINNFSGVSQSFINNIQAGNSGSTQLTFGTSGPTDSTAVEKMRITNDGYLRLSTNSPGIQFNGDTSASNALDDYEEGTWTMGVSFGGGSTGITYSTNTGRYTKVGNMVNVVGYIELSNKGTSSGAARVTGLPFTIASGNTNYSAPAMRLNRISYATQYTGFGEPSNTTIILTESTVLGVETALDETNFANNSEIILSFTYFV